MAFYSFYVHLSKRETYIFLRMLCLLLHGLLQAFFFLVLIFPSNVGVGRKPAMSGARPCFVGAVQVNMRSVTDLLIFFRSG